MIDDERLHFQPVGSASLKGVAEPVALYRVLASEFPGPTYLGVEEN